MGPRDIAGYFQLSDKLAIERLTRLKELYGFWNEKINVISRRDLPNLYLNHVLHSLCLAKVIPFGRGEEVVDIGTGGGFPGIPLAILYQDVHFTLIDSVGKKIKVVNSIIKELGLTNTEAVNMRAEDYRQPSNYILSRAVCSLTKLVKLSGNMLRESHDIKIHHGIYSLKGGDLANELSDWRNRVKVFPVSDYFPEQFFLNKYIVFLPAKELFPAK